jgi:hypothetical protein
VKPYLTQLYRDLTLRSYDQRAIDSKTLDKITFIDYSKLPVVLAERLFSLFDDKKDGTMTEDAFVNLMVTVFISDF